MIGILLARMVGGWPYYYPHDDVIILVMTTDGRTDELHDYFVDGR